MPKIPTFTSESRITAEPTGIISGSNISLNQNIGEALKPLIDFTTDAYVKEKKLEADNKAYALLSDMYIDQKDSNGEIIQKGLLTIQSETSANGEPSAAAKYNDIETNKLYNYFKSNKFNNIDNYTKKIIASKFFSTAGILKTTSLEGSRNTQISDSVKIDEDYISKEALVLKNTGLLYLPIYKQKVIDKIKANTTYDEGQDKILIETFTKFGVATLAESMANNQPVSFKQALEEGKFDILTPEEKNKLISISDTNIKNQKFETLLSGLDVPFDADPRDFIIANEEIQNKNFGNNKQLQTIYDSFNAQEVVEFEEAYRKKASEIKSDRNMNILTMAQVGKITAAQNTNEIFKELDKKNGIYNEKIQQLFPENDKIEQLTNFSLKISEDSVNKVSNFDKNDDIIKLIINDEINSVYDKFILPGETESLSVIERAGKQVNIADVKYLNNLFEISSEEGFKENHTNFFKFIDMFGLEVAGSSALKMLDSKRDQRLNNFKYTMYNRYIIGLQNGHTSNELLKPTKGNKKFIGYDFHTFIPNMDDVFKDISESIKKGTEDFPEIPMQKKKTKKELENELGRAISISEYEELTKEN